MRKKTVSGLAVALAATTGLGLAMAAPASANGGNSHRTGSCSADSTWELKASANRGGDGHTVEVRFRIRSADGGQTWDWTITDNGNVAAAGQNTAEDNGKLDVEQTIPNLKGFDKITLDASNAATGETCHGHVLLNGSH